MIERSDKKCRGIRSQRVCQEGELVPNKNPGLGHGHSRYIVSGSDYITGLESRQGQNISTNWQWESKLIPTNENQGKFRDTST